MRFFSRLTAFLFLFLLSTATARSEIILEENFEGDGQTCGTIGTYQEVYQVNIDDTLPHSGRCSGWHHYLRNEDAAYLRHAGIPTKTLHGIYWVYYSNSGAWPRHQKMNRFYIGASSGKAMAAIAHPYQGSRRHVLVDYNNEPPLSCSHLKESSWSGLEGKWHEVEFLMELNAGASSGTCSGANDLLKVWIDSKLVIDNHSMNGTNGNTSWNFVNFWLFGNSSAASGQCDGAGGCKTVYLDDICISTTASECGGLAGTEPGYSNKVTPPVIRRDPDEVKN